MPFQGAFSSMPLPDLIQWLGAGRKTGMLQVRNPVGVTKKVYFKDGRVYAAASNEPREYLGHFLIGRGLITEAQLEMAIRTQEQTGIMLGKILCTIGAIDDAQLGEALDIKIKETVYSLFLWPQADFEFFEGQKISGEFVPMDLDATFLIMEGTRRQDEYVRIKQVIPGLGAVLELAGVYPGADTVEEYPLSISIFERLDGHKSLSAIALDLHAEDYDILAAAMALVEIGAARVTEVRASQSSQWQTTVQQQIFDKAKAQFAAGEFAAAGNLCQYLIQNELFVVEAQKMRAECDLKTKVDWDVEAPLDQVPELIVSLTQLTNHALSPSEGFLASRVNGHYTLKSILQITPIPELEARRAIKNLKDKGILRFKPKAAEPGKGAMNEPKKAVQKETVRPLKK